MIILYGAMIYTADELNFRPIQNTIPLGNSPSDYTMDNQIIYMSEVHIRICR